MSDVSYLDIIPESRRTAFPRTVEFIVEMLQAELEKSRLNRQEEKDNGKVQQQTIHRQ